MNELFVDESYKPLLVKSISHSAASPMDDKPRVLAPLNSVET